MVPLADFLVHHYRPLSVRRKQLVTAGLIIPAVATLFLHVPFLTMNVPWPGKSHPFKKLLGWRQLGAEVTQIGRSMDKPCLHPGRLLHDRLGAGVLHRRPPHRLLRQPGPPDEPVRHLAGF